MPKRSAGVSLNASHAKNHTCPVRRERPHGAASAATRPWFLYLPFQSVHGPEEVPESFKELYNQSGSEHYIATESRRTHQGMVTALDEAVGNLTDTFKETGLYNHSLIWFSSDNGGPLGAANNFPLRYGDDDARTHARTQHHAERLAISV